MRPGLEVADILRRLGPAWAARHAGPWRRKMSATSSPGRIARSAAGPRPLLDQRHDPIERTRHGADRPGRDPGIECGVVELGVSEQNLDHADIDAIFTQMRGEA